MNGQTNLKNKHIRSTKKAFTLAEVLITLTIVGIIASLTIPSLVNNVNNATNVAQLKKTYSTLQQAFMLVQADNGGDISPIFNSGDTGANVMNAFLTKLNYVKNCGNGMGCWYNTERRILNGTINGATIDANWNGTYGKAILANGAMLRMETLSASCANSARGTGIGPLANSTCGELYIDINGSTGPNQVGRDYFGFYITKTGIYPIGTFNDGGECVINGYGCAAKVLTEGAMNY